MAAVSQPNCPVASHANTEPGPDQLLADQPSPELAPAPAPLVPVRSRADEPPDGPRGRPVIGVLPQLMKNPADFTVRVMEEFGSPARLNLGFATVYLVTHPDHVDHVMVANSRNYWKGVLFKGAKPLFGDGLLLNEGDSWLRQRRLMQPAFVHGRLGQLISVMTDVITKKISAWRDSAESGRPLEMWTEMMSLTSDIIIRTMFTLSVTEEERHRMATAFHEVFVHVDYRFLGFFLPNWVPLPGQRAYQRALSYLDDTVYRIIRERRSSRQSYNDLLSMLLEVRDADSGEGMSDKQLRDELIGIFFGGYEATATALAWAWYMLSQHPEVEQRFREEVDAVLGGETPTLESIGNLTYTKMVIDETLRLYPPFWTNFRTTYSADEIGGYRIPPNSPLLVSTYATHRMSEFWPDPEVFDPQRFEPQRVASRPRYAHIPFGAGQRTCIGKNLALLEIPMILAMVTQAYRVEAVPEHVVKPQVRHSVRARDGIMMTLVKR